MNHVIHKVQPKRVKLSRNNGYCLAGMAGLLILGAVTVPAFAADKSSFVAPSQEDVRLYVSGQLTPHTNKNQLLA